MKLSKIFSMLLIIVLAVTCFVSAVSAAPVWQGGQSGRPGQSQQGTIHEGDISYKISRSGEVSITKCNVSYTGAIEIPEVIEDKPVVSIEDYAFQHCVNLTGVVLPSTITQIGYSAFYGCTALESINIPANVNKIEYGAFYNCKALKDADIADLAAWCSAELDGEYANPMHITGELKIDGEVLTELSIPDFVTVVSDYVFYGCKGLTSVTMSSVTSIGECAFYGCEGLTEMNISAGVTEIGDGAFSACNGLKEIKVDAANTKYSNASGNLIENETGTLIRGTDSGVIPSDGSVKRLGDYAFSGNVALTDIEIPAVVTVIGASAFRDCPNLKSAKLPDTITVIRAGVFSGCEKLTSVNIPEKVTALGTSTFRGCKALTEIKIPAECTDIGNFVFVDCDSLTSVTIPKTVKILGEGVFDDCSKLAEIKVENGNGRYFSNGTCLIDLDGYVLLRGGKYSVIPDWVRTIGKHSFSGCADMKVIGIPTSITSVEANAFYGCDALQQVYYGGDEEAFKKVRVSANNDKFKSAEVVYNNDNAPVPKLPGTSDGLFGGVGIGSDGDSTSGILWIIIAAVAVVIIAVAVVVIVVLKKKKAKA